MWVQPSFGTEFSGVKIDKFISLTFDITKGSPVAKKIKEILEAKQKSPEEDFGEVISEVAEANKCQSLVYERRGKRKILWGLYEEGPVEKVSITIRAHYCAQKQGG